jgi:thymidylate kinase
VDATVVELAGLPGSGKSTLAEALRRRLRDDGVPCTIDDSGVSARARKEVRMLRRGGHALREIAVEPDASRRAIRELVRSGQRSRRDAAAVLAQWLAIADIASRGRRRPGVHLLEEGPVQTTWTALLRADRLRPEALWPCLPADAHSDLVLFVDVRPEVAADRLTQRASRHSRLQRIPSEQLLGELRRGQAILDDLMLTCPWRVTRIPSADESVESLAVRASAVVHALAGTAPRGAPIRDR